MAAVLTTGTALMPEPVQRSEHTQPLPWESTNVTGIWTCHSRQETMHTAKIWRSTSPWKTAEQWELKASFEDIR